MWWSNGRKGCDLPSRAPGDHSRCGVDRRSVLKKLKSDPALAEICRIVTIVDNELRT